MKMYLQQNAHTVYKGMVILLYILSCMLQLSFAILRDG